MPALHVTGWEKVAKTLDRPRNRFCVRRPHGSRRAWLAVSPSISTAWALLFVVLTAASAAGQVPFFMEGSRVYTVLLESPSVGEQLREEIGEDGFLPARRAPASRALMRRAVSRTQEPVLGELDSRGIQVVGAVQSVLNAVFVRASPEQAELIGELPGVAGVSPGRQYEAALKSVSEVVHVSAARMRVTGSKLFGDGMKIAVIDSGLDFDHEAFQAGSLPELRGYPRGDASHLSLASKKVIAVRSYVEHLNSKSRFTSSPDDNSPWDSSGHGTAVAMIAAGNSVESPLGTVSGIAPNARIGVYKVFGTPGLNFYTADHVVIMAIDDAVEDGMDILNLSLGNPTYYPWHATGSDCGIRAPSAPCDPLAAAAQSAVEDFGRVVVVAAGNFGLRGTEWVPARTTINSPGDAPYVITVGETGNAVRLTESIRVGEEVFDALSGSGPDAPGPLTAPAVLASEVGDPLACEPFPGGVFLDSIAVIDRSGCFFVEKVEHADAAGASAAIVINNQGDELVEMALLSGTDIPAFFVGSADGARIRETVSESQAEVTLDPTPISQDREWRFVAPESSRGPTLAKDPKPDIVAPGVDVYTAAPAYNHQGVLFNPGGFRALSGTSFASPAVAGAAALVWQAFPWLNARQVSSALINSAMPLTTSEDEMAPLTSAGAGVLDIQAALLPTATVVPSSIGFGDLQNSPHPIRRTLTITNKSSRQQTFRVTIEPSTPEPSARILVDNRYVVTFDLGVRASRDLDVVLAGGLPFHGSYEGRLRVSSLTGSGDVLVPYLYIHGDNEPYNAIPFQGQLESGVAGEPATKRLVARILDQFGSPVVGREVTFTALEGSPEVMQSSRTSGLNGLIYALVRYPGDAEPQSVVAQIGDIEIPFSFVASESEPVISSINNTASLASEKGVAPGSLATITGGPFSMFSSGAVNAPQARPLPILRKGVTVAFDVPELGISTAGRIHSVDEDSIAVQVPWELSQAGVAWVKVRADNRSDPFRFELVSADPGIFGYESEGRQYALALHADDSLVTTEAPAGCGRSITFSMTGNGPVTSPPATGMAAEILVSTVSTPEVSIGGVPAEVTYSGLGPGLAGLYLVTVVVPEGLTPGDHPVRVRFGSASSNEVLLPVQ